MAPLIPATLIAGDGIGREIVDATLATIEALDVRFDWDSQVAGVAGVQAVGIHCPAPRWIASTGPD